MRLRLVAAGTRLPDWVNAGFQHYASRLPRECALDLTEIPLGVRGKNKDPARAVSEEEKRMLVLPRGGDIVVAMEVAGKQFDSGQLARRMEGWFAGGGDVLFMVGGPDGPGRRLQRKGKSQMVVVGPDSAAWPCAHPLGRTTLPRVVDSQESPVSSRLRAKSRRRWLGGDQIPCAGRPLQRN